MFARFSRFLTTPALNNEDHLRVVVLLKAIIFSGAAAVILSVVVRIAVAPDTLAFTWLNGLTLGLLAALWMLTRRGYVFAVSAALSAGMWIIITAAVLNYGTGIFAPSYVYYGVILVITGLTLGERKAAVLSAATILMGLYMAWIAADGRLLTATGAAPSLLLWVNSSFAFAVIVLLTGVAHRGILKALERARLGEAILEEQNAQLQTKTASLAAINAIAAALHESLDFKTVADRALSEIQTYARAVGSALYYIDDPSGEMRLLTYNYLFQGLAIHSMDDQEGRLSAAAVREKRLLVSEDIVSDPRVSNPAVRQAFIDNGIVSGAAIPLILHEKVMGAVGLSFTEKRQLSAEEQATLLSIGNTIALAIDNARRVSQIETETAERLRAEAAQQTAEDKYRSIVDNAIEGIFQSTLEGHILMANQAFAHMLGYDSPQTLINEVIDVGQQLYVHPEQRQEIVRRYVEDGELRAYQCQLYRRDGSVIWISQNSRSVRDEYGQLLYFEGMVEDITERQLIQDALMESEERFRVISSVTTDYTYSSRINAQGELEQGLLTGALETITGYTPEEFIAQGGWRTMLHPEEKEHDTRNLEALKQNQQVDFETRIIRKDGQIRHVRVYGIPVWDEEQQKLVGINGAVQDITKRKLAEENLRQAHLRLEAAYDNLERLIQQIPIGIEVFDTNGICTNVNQAQKNIFGVTSSEMVVGKFNVLTDPLAEIIGAQASFRRALCGEIVDMGEVRFDFTQADPNFSTLTGERYLTVAFFPIYDENHTITSVVALNRDITERRHAQENLRQSNLRLEASNDTLRRLIQQIPIGVQIFDTSGLCIDVNEVYLDIFKVGNRDQVVGKFNLFEHMRADDNGVANIVQTAFRKGLAGEMVHLGELQMNFTSSDRRFSSRSGPLTVEVYFCPIYDENHQITSMVALNHDITERRMAEEALRQSEARFRAIFEQTSEGVFRSTYDGRFVFVNQGLVRLLGYDTIEEVLALDIPTELYIHPEDRIELSRRLDIADDMSSNEIELKSKQGTPIPVNVSSYAVRDANGDILYYEGIITDLTEIKQAQQREIELAVAIERARVDVLKEFLDSATHDLRTPLTTMNTSIYLLRRTAESEKQIQYIDRLEVQTRHIHQLIENLFRLSRLDMAASEFEFAACDLNQLVARAVAQEQALAESKGHTIILEHPDERLSVRADVAELTEALRHITTNACNYTPDGGTITIRVDADNGQAVVTVSDTGIGIDDAELPMIFERFYRADKARQVTTGAAGLGLTIARKIIEAHQGHISAESRPGEGSTFRVYLPLVTNR